MGQESRQLVEEQKKRILPAYFPAYFPCTSHTSQDFKEQLGRVWAWLLCNLSREESAVRAFLGLPLSQPGKVSLGPV